MKLFRLILTVQATYIFIVAIWPLVDIQSFVEVTGYKTDLWLVKTVGALLIPIAISLYMHLFIRTDHRPAIALAALTAAAFIWIDFYYAFTGVIADIYLADGILEIVFFLAWLYIALFKKVATN